MAGTKWNNAVTSREEQHEKKRLAVLLAGAKLFCDRGYERTSLDDIARELNITKRTIYYYVDSKDDILFECMKMALKFIDDVIEHSSDTSVDPLDRIRELVDNYITWVSTDLGACLALIRDYGLSDIRRAEVRESKLVLDKHLRDLIRQGIENGTIRPCDPKLASAAIFGTLNWIPFWNRNDRPTSNAELSAEIGEFTINGLMLKRR